MVEAADELDALFTFTGLLLDRIEALEGALGEATGDLSISARLASLERLMSRVANTGLLDAGVSLRARVEEIEGRRVGLQPLEGLRDPV